MCKAGQNANPAKNAKQIFNQGFIKHNRKISTLLKTLAT